MLTHVSAKGAEWIHDVVTARVPQAVLFPNPFHVVAWATKALDEVRHGASRSAAPHRASRSGHHDQIHRCVLLKPLRPDR
jgi:transposase